MSLQHNVWSYMKSLFHSYDGKVDSGGTTVDIDTNIRLAYRFPVNYAKTAADGAASDVTAVQYFWYAPRACRIVSAYICPTSTLTAHDTTYATILIKNSAGTTLCTAATTTTGTGSWTAGAEKVMTISSETIASGETLAFQITKASTGVVVPICTVALEIEWT